MWEFIKWVEWPAFALDRLGSAILSFSVPISFFALFAENQHWQPIARIT